MSYLVRVYIANIGVKILLSVVVQAAGQDNEGILSESITKDCYFRFNASVKIPTEINVCSLSANFQVVMEKKTYSRLQRVLGSREIPPSTVHILRYYVISLFSRIPMTTPVNNSLPLKPSYIDLSTSTNCPQKSMVCLVSHVEFECDQTAQTAGTCTKPAAQVTADSYGYFKTWKVTLFRPRFEARDTNLAVVKTVAMQMSAGPCYYCDVTKKFDGKVLNNKGAKVLKLKTKIEFYCDERIVDNGSPTVDQNATSANPRASFRWITSEACYVFQSNRETCSWNHQPASSVCQLQSKKTFKCNSHPSNYQFIFPPKANHSISCISSISTTTEFVFGLCANDVSCETTTKESTNDGTDVMICQVEHGDITINTPLVYYHDIIDIILRPTGFVWRIYKGQANSMSSKASAIVSFLCAETNEMEFYVVEDETLPVLFVLKHKCFCPNASCQELVPTPQPSGGNPPNSLLWILPLVVIIVVIIFIIFYRIWRPRPEVNRNQLNPANQAIVQPGSPEPSETTPLLIEETAT